MANPTTAKPSTAELKSDHDCYAAAKCFVPIVAGEYVPRDIVNNAIGEVFAGTAVQQTGPLVTYSATGFDAGGLAEPSYRAYVGDSGFIFPGSGWSSTTTPRTIACVAKFRHNANAANGGAHIVALCGSGSDTSFHGIAASINTSGVITLGFYRSQAFFSSGITLTAGRWYALAVTIAASSGAESRYFFAYDYTAQSETTSEGMSDATAYAAGTSGNASINAGIGNSVWNGAATDNPFIGDIACFGLFNETWVPSVGPNTKWQQFYTDPWALARGSYTPAGALTAGTVSSSPTTTGVRLAATRPSGGTAPYTIQWYRSTTSGFTPGAGNILTGATALQYLDSTAVFGTAYFYKAVWTDSAETPASVTSDQIVGATDLASGRFGIIGSSSMASNRAGRAIMRAITAAGGRFGLLNRAKGATYSYYATAASSWQPSAYQSGTTLFDQAVDEMLAGGVTHVIVNLGAADLTVPISASDYTTYMTRIVTTLVANGFKVLLIGPQYVWSTSAADEAKNEIGRQYHSILQSLANGSTVLYLGDGFLQLVARYKRALHPDGQHFDPNDHWDSIAGMHLAWKVVDAVIDPLPTPSAVAAAVVASSTPPTPTWWVRADYGLYDSLLHAIETDGIEVRQWRDKSYGSNGFYWQNTTANAYPVYRASGQNGKPYLSFDGVNDWLEGKHAGMLVNFGSYEVWFVVDPKRTTGDGYFLGCGAVDGNDSPPNLVALCTSTPAGKIGYQQHNPTSNWYRLADATTGAQILRYSFDAVAGTGTLYRNGVLLGSDYYLDAGDMNYVALASRHDNGDYQMQVDFYEMRMFTQTLNPAQAATLLQQLNDSYNIL